MKLNLNCIRDILQFVEANSTDGKSVTFMVEEDLKSYTEDELVFHLEYLDDEGYIERTKTFVNGSCVIKPLDTPTLDILSYITNQR